MTEDPQGDSFTQKIGCLVMAIAIILLLLIPVTGGISAAFGIPLLYAGRSLLIHGERMAKGQEGCRQGCLGCCLPGIGAFGVLVILLNTVI